MLNRIESVPFTATRPVDVVAFHPVIADDEKIHRPSPRFGVLRHYSAQTGLVASRTLLKNDSPVGIPSLLGAFASAN